MSFGRRNESSTNAGDGCVDTTPLVMRNDAMDRAKRRRLEASGWRVGSTQELLKLSDDEMALIDMKISLVQFVREQRGRAKLSQTTLATRLGSSQSRIAKLEAGDPNVSLDLLVRAAIAAGASRSAVARAMGPKRRSARRSS
jgi:DNA-binding XRE family transcriptional regulator